jgi:DNA-binding response OmpR family regulator
MPGVRILFVDDEEAIRITLSAVLSKHGYQVDVAATVGEA